MAIGTPSALGSASATDTGNTRAITPVTASVGDFVIVYWSFVFFTGATVADSAGNTYQVDREQVDANGQYAGIASSRLTSALTSGTITVTASTGGFFSTRAAAAFKVTGLATTSWLDKVSSDTSGGGTGTAADSAATTATAQADGLAVGVVGTNGANTATVGGTGTYTEIHDVSGASIQAAYQILSSTGTQRYQPTLSVARSWACIVATYKADAGGAAGIVSPLQSFGPSYAAHRAASI